MISKPLTLLFCFSCLACVLSAGAAQPNIVIVMTDDMGYGDTGATGNPIIRTPNLDRFSKEGASLTNYYVSPVCSPTRACLMTGRYNYRTRVIDTFKGRSMMDPEEVTVAEALKGAGYTTGIFGKWHLGDNFPLRPQEQGFDEVLVLRGGGLAQPSEPIENQQRYTDPILFHNGEKVQTKGYCTDVYFDAAIEFMNEAKADGKPFFVYLPTNAPHGPFHDVPEDLLAYYKSLDLTPVLNGNTSEKHADTVARVYAMVENVDQNMGKLDAFLEESGLRENTLVMFFTDNGPNTPRFVGPFRGKKSEVLEGGVHTMFWARWPEKIQPGTASDRIAAHIDVMPTLLDVAGAEQPEGVKLDGVSLLPLLLGEDVDWTGRTLFFQSHRGNEPVEFHNFAARQQDWKLLHATGFGSETGKEGVPFELYRVGEDLGESNGLAGEEPEKVAGLKEAYRAWFKDVSTTRPDNYDPPRIVIGSDEELVTELSIQDWRVEPDAAGWGTSGKWYVDVIDEGPYDAVVTWDKEIGSHEVTLRVGEKSFQGKLEEGEMAVTWPEVSLPQGKMAISVEIGGKISRDQILRFVTLKRKSR